MALLQLTVWLFKVGKASLFFVSDATYFTYHTCVSPTMFSHLYEWFPSAWRHALQPAGTDSSPGCCPFAPEHHWLPSKSWPGARWAPLYARTFSLPRQNSQLNHSIINQAALRLDVWFSFICTCHVLLHKWFLLQELGPSHGASVEHRYVLIHHLLVGVKVIMPLKAVGVDPVGTNSLRSKAFINKWQCTEQHSEERTGPTLLSPLFPDDGHYNSLLRVWVSIVGRSNGPAGWLVRFRLLLCGIRSREQHSSWEMSSEILLYF